jgi:UDP-N-acetylglucosamine--N-acetylmuramyl-(pentapeptide) pyrophosphoryl-undecaprenol N-acetylglucosamine transferase
MKTVLVCGGGTGGHLYPALAILEGLCEVLYRPVYVGSRYGLEREVVPRSSSRSMRIYLLPVRSLTRPGQRSLWFFWALWALLLLPMALLRALFVLLKTRPALIVGTGGYAAFPPLFWGILLKIPTLIHEQNLSPGLVNRLLAPWVSTVCVTYPESAQYLRARKLVVTGLPIRPQILAARPDAKRFQLRPDRKTVLVFGGSRGSRLLTERALALRDELKELQLLIVTGDRHGRLNGEGAHTVLVPYITEMGEALATADVVVARAGASTLSELAALRKPAVIVPWRGAANDHQMANAQRLSGSASWCSVLPEGELSSERLAQEIRSLLKYSPSPTTRSLPASGEGQGGGEGKRDALQSILHEIEVLLDEERTKP